MACLHCLYHCAAAAPQLDLAPAQSQHPTSGLVCKQGHGRLYWEGELQPTLAQISWQFSQAYGVCFQKFGTFRAEIYQLKEADLDFCSARSVSVSQCNLHLFSSACVQEGSGRVTVLDLHLCIAEASLTSAGRRHV